MIIRTAVEADIHAILAIYNEAILHTVATFDTVPRTLEQQEQWFKQHGTRYPVLVAELGGIVVGWASLNPYSDRLAYERTSELSMYIQPDFRGQGIGKQLMEHILKAGKEAGLHTVLSRIVEGNDSSIYIHRTFGFDYIGVMREVGFKFDRMLDVILMQRML